jgi:hypothetical protein
LPAVLQAKDRLPSRRLPGKSQPSFRSADSTQKPEAGEETDCSASHTLIRPLGRGDGVLSPQRCCWLHVSLWYPLTQHPPFLTTGLSTSDSHDSADPPSEQALVPGAELLAPLPANLWEPGLQQAYRHVQVNLARQIPNSSENTAAFVHSAGANGGTILTSGPPNEQREKPKLLRTQRIDVS